MTRSSARREGVIRADITTHIDSSQQPGWQDASDSVIPLFSREVLCWLESDNFFSFARGGKPIKRRSADH